MNYYFVDYENVRAEGMKELANVKENDAIVIFFSEQCKNISLDVLANMTRQNTKVMCFKAITGTKNALDFQLSSYLGYLMGQEQNEAAYYIISNDKGFDCLCTFWKDQGKSVERIALQDKEKTTTKEKASPQEKAQTKEKAPAKEKKATPPKKASKVLDTDLATIEEIRKYLSEDDSPEEVLAIFNQYKTKTAIANGMSKKFKDTKRVSTIYKKLKPLLKAKKKS